MIPRKEALFYYSELVRRFGGSDGVRDEGLLDAALDRPFATFGWVDLFATPQEKAAAVMHGVFPVIRSLTATSGQAMRWLASFCKMQVSIFKRIRRRSTTW